LLAVLGVGHTTAQFKATEHTTVGFHLASCILFFCCYIVPPRSFKGTTTGLYTKQIGCLSARCLQSTVACSRLANYKRMTRVGASTDDINGRQNTSKLSWDSTVSVRPAKQRRERIWQRVATAAGRKRCVVRTRHEEDGYNLVKGAVRERAELRLSRGREQPALTAGSN
jgi:hypothetical protein